MALSLSDGVRCHFYIPTNRGGTLSLTIAWQLISKSSAAYSHLKPR